MEFDLRFEVDLHYGTVKQKELIVFQELSLYSPTEASRRRRRSSTWTPRASSAHADGGRPRDSGGAGGDSGSAVKELLQGLQKDREGQPQQAWSSLVSGVDDRGKEVPGRAYCVHAAG